MSDEEKAEAKVAEEKAAGGESATQVAAPEEAPAKALHEIVAAKGTRIYELLLLFDPHVAQKSWDEIVGWLRQLLARFEGVFIKDPELWGENRKLAYEIAGLRRGTYMLVYFQAPPAGITEMERSLRLDERVLRHMVVVHGKSVPAPAPPRRSRYREQDSRGRDRDSRGRDRDSRSRGRDRRDRGQRNGE